ncbi:MAG: hypothetical protein B6U94_01580 [Thermofilum sp. ex4484_79]|nr:MAG: hypothetical protein B6U94_01580 [Thermofilum sp. ex4484_79]
MYRKVVKVDSFGDVFVDEEEIEKPGRGEILVKVKYSVISSGTELAGIISRRKSKNPDLKAYTLGYSNSGVVVSLGSNVRGFKIGDRVACMGSGYAVHGTYSIVPQNLCVHIPDEVSFEETAFNHLAATSLNAVRRARVEIGEYVAVFGLGLIGQFCCQFSYLAGAHVIGLDPYELRREKAKIYGAQYTLDISENIKERIREITRGYGLDCGFICYGGNADQTFDVLAENIHKAPDTHGFGRIVVVGGVHATLRFPTFFGNIDILPSSRTGPGYHDEAWERGKNYVNLIRWNTRRNLEEFLIFLKEGRIKVNHLITHIFPLDDAPKAYEYILSHPDKTLGVLLKI